MAHTCGGNTGFGVSLLALVSSDLSMGVSLDLEDLV